MIRKYYSNSSESRKSSVSIILALFSFLTLFSANSNVYGQTNETLTAGAYIVDMGQMPQTIENAIVPYGMVYDLLENYNVDVKWIINGTKAKDGTDFTYNGYDYKGGPFIIPSEYRSPAVDAAISSWELAGVVGTTTTTPITVPVYTTIKDMPVWTLDDGNGGIAEGYLENALIPASAYNFEDPQNLDCCDDLFAMPHADPEWDTHSNLYDWNLNCQGEIWMACHAGSAFMNTYNYDLGGDPDEQMNFLSTKTGVAMGNDTWADPANSLILWGDHDSGTPPYNYNFPSNPVMQFLGIIDGATQNGSEQIYIPVDGADWNPNSVMVYDPDHPDASGTTQNDVAAVVVYDHGFGDPNRGRVMLEAAHSHDGSDPEEVAAQRIFFNFSFFSNNENAIIPDVSGNPTSYVGGVSTNLSFVLPPGEDINDYSIVWSDNCGGTFSPTNTQNTSYTPPSVTMSTPCIIYVAITDMCGNTTTDNIPVTVTCDLGLTFNATNITCFGQVNGEISFSVASGSAPYQYDWSLQGGGSGTGMGSPITGLSAGTYDVTITDNGGAGCPQSFTVAIVEPPLLLLTTDVTDAICGGDPSGALNLNVSGGTPSYTYNWSSGQTTEDLSNIVPGLYTVTVTDANTCTQITAANVGSPAPMVISPTITPTACFGDTNGAISLSVSGGAGGYSYAWNDGPSTQNRTGLTANTYMVTVTDQDNCTNSASIIVGGPAMDITPSATVSDISCNGNFDGEIDLEVTGGTAPYSYNWSHGPITQDVIALGVGTYTVTITDSNFCTKELSYPIAQPPQLLITAVCTNASCPGFTDGDIDITVTGGTPGYTYDWSNNGAQDPDSDPEDLIGIAAGTYSVTVMDANACIATLTKTIDSDNTIPTDPTEINHD